LACCAYQKCGGILLNPAVVAPDFLAHLDIKDAGDMLQLDYRKQNGKAYMLLNQSISPSDTITFYAVQSAVTTELPSGDAKQAWKNICEIDQTATKADQHDLEQ
jgi:hypothetical protein